MFLEAPSPCTERRPISHDFVFSASADFAGHAVFPVNVLSFGETSSTTAGAEPVIPPGSLSTEEEVTASTLAFFRALRHEVHVLKAILLSIPRKPSAAFRVFVENLNAEFEPLDCHELNGETAMHIVRVCTAARDALLSETPSLTEWVRVSDIADEGAPDRVVPSRFVVEAAPEPPPVLAWNEARTRIMRLASEFRAGD